MSNTRGQPSVSASPGLAEALLARLRRSPQWTQYQGAFEAATGLPLWLDQLEGAGADGTAHWSHQANPFCAQMFEHEETRILCTAHHKSLAHHEAGVATTCPAGMHESAVPVWVGRQIVGYLRTGQILAETPTAEGWDKLAQLLRGHDDVTIADLTSLRTAYLASPTAGAAQFSGAVHLLSQFSGLLAATLERLHQESGPEPWPEPVHKAVRLLRARFAEDVPLAELARAAGLSANYLCTVFKDTTGVTPTEFINRERILQAKKRLRSRAARIGEVALDIGFGSLSQFNRSFAKYAGESPTDYRRRVLGPANGRN